MLAVGLIKNFDQSSARQDEIVSIPPVVKGQFPQSQHEGGERSSHSEEADSLYNNQTQQNEESRDASQNYSNIAAQNNADNNSNGEKYYQDKEVYVLPIDTKSAGSSEQDPNKVLIPSTDSRRGRKQIIAVGLVAAILYGVAQGFMDVGEKVGLEKENLKIYQLLLPQAVMMIIGSCLYGALNSVKFREDGIYSYSSFSLPGSPFVHQMLVHRSMMSVLSMFCTIYTMANLPENVAIALLMLMPFFVGLAALTFEQELLSKMQLFSIMASYLGVLLITNPEIFQKENRAHLLQQEKVWKFVRQGFVPIVTGLAASIFGAFNYLAARRISSQVHPCIETMYIGIVQILISLLCLIYYKPSYFKIWQAQYTQEQVLYTMIISSLYYVSQESLSTALESLKAGTVATFNHLSVLIAYAGYKFFRIILVKK